jgi:hypothetical protein
MRRETVGSSAHSAKLGSSSRATTRKVKHNTIFPSADLDAGRNDSPKGVPIVQPYGFAYWPAKQDEEEDKGGGEKGGGGDGESAGNGGGGAFEDDDQPKGKSAVGLTSYANGSRSDPSVQNLQDPRHQMMLENEDGQGKEDHGGREGDVSLYHQADKGIQLHFAGGDEKSGLKPGAYLSTRADKNKIRLQLVKVDDDSSQKSAPAGGGGQQQKKKAEGQRPLLKKESSTFIDIDGGGNTITVKHGSTTVQLTGEKVVGFYGDEKQSFLVDKEHTHIRCKDMRIWVDEFGCWATVPILVKQDEKDKS